MWKVKLGTHIRMADGREGTVVFNGLIGVGVKWGIHYPNPKDFEGTTGGCMADDPKPEDWPWKPGALLREPWAGCQYYGFQRTECVGEDYERIETAPQQAKEGIDK